MSKAVRLGNYYRHELLNLFELFSDIKTHDKILDIGGFDGLILSRLKGDNKTLIDINAVSDFENINYIKDDFFKQNFVENSFDWILAFDVLEHLPLEEEAMFFKRIQK